MNIVAVLWCNAGNRKYICVLVAAGDAMRTLTADYAKTDIFYYCDVCRNIDLCSSGIKLVSGKKRAVVLALNAFQINYQKKF